LRTLYKQKRSVTHAEQRVRQVQENTIQLLENTVLTVTP